MVQVGSTECKYPSKFEIIIIVFSSYIALKKIFEIYKLICESGSQSKNLSSSGTAKLMFMLYQSSSLRLLPLFKYVLIFWLSALYDEIKSGCFSYIKQKTTFKSKNLKWTFAALKTTSSYHTVQVATLQNIYFENKVGSSSDSSRIFILKKYFFVFKVDTT